jgi:hypothetical protein
MGMGARFSGKLSTNKSVRKIEISNESIAMSESDVNNFALISSVRAE